MLDMLAEEFSRPTSLPIAVVVLRLVMAVLLGGVIGWEREVHARAAGLRTHMLITLAAACFTLVAMELTELNANDHQQRTDPLRLIEAVTAGVAFLAAGSIVINKGNVRGITTGASMWLCGAIGLCCGTGDLWLALIATAMAMAVLYLIRILITPVAQEVAEETGEAGD
ncbi:MgtC/SapB family protein [Paracoccus binzhouensis]|uniref:MgtC/SapB family protein n=1 Tax=Paracoccus binzhouensis TaxID=2796149 RepID=UPI0018EEEB0A|nr:MgtC/SapB family protein [Paracoccus binzhouensis]